MSEANFNLPNIFEDTNMNDASIRQIKNYLYQLTEQLKYMMNNIDSDNMTASYQDSIKRAVEAAEKVDTMSEVLETNLGITNRVLNERATQIIEFNDLICKSLGLFKTEVTQEDGSVKYYMHDASTLEDSETIYTLTSNGYAWTNDGWNGGNPVWEYGVDKDGNAIYKALSVYKLVANLIEAGTIQSADGSSFWNLENGNSSFKGTFKNEDDMGNVTYVTHAQEILGLEHYANYAGVFIFDRGTAAAISAPPTVEDLKNAMISAYTYDEYDGVAGTWLNEPVVKFRLSGKIDIPTTMFKPKIVPNGSAFNWLIDVGWYYQDTSAETLNNSDMPTAGAFIMRVTDLAPETPGSNIRQDLYYLSGATYTRVRYGWESTPWQPWIPKDGAVAGLSYVNGWKSYGSGYSSLAYIIHGNMIHLRGLIKNDSSSNVLLPIAYLPEGYRPGYNHIYKCSCQGGWADVYIVSSNGQIYIPSATNYSGSPAGYLSLDGISFIKGG